jgi:3-deoxy-D-manno-octulosonic-acid transferase
MQGVLDAERLARLGVERERIYVTGNLKRAARHGDGMAGKGHEGRGFSLGQRERQILVAGSTHRGEEEVLLEAFLLLKASFPKLLLVLAPRHPQRFSEVERLLKKKQVSYERKSRLNGSGEETPVDVIFLDTIGELAGFYALADVAFVGGSLVDSGGHNPMEPARLGKPVLFGPFMQNFAEISTELKQKGGGIEVRGKEDFIRESSALLSDRLKAEKVGALACRIVEGDRGVVEKSMELIARYL